MSLSGLKLVALLYVGSVVGLVADFHLPDGGRTAISAHGSAYDNDTEVSHGPKTLATAGWTSLGCYTDSVSARTLTTSEAVAGGANAMTNELCQTACLNAGYSIAGTEYAGECWCGNSFSNGGGPAPDGSAGCNMACKGNAGETCGGPNRLTTWQHSGGGTSPPPGGSYTLKNSYTAANFFSQVSFFTQGDPTHGFVQYLSQSQAQSQGLINTNNNQIYMGVDYTTANPSGGRSSVRVTSNQAWTHGLFLADIAHMPGGICGTWPAFWLVGPNWPYNGEIDIIEGVHQSTTDSITLHTAAGCNINIAGSNPGSVLSYTNCNTANANDGCGVSTTNTQGYGSGFNAIGGGVYATLWTSSAIEVWFFPRNAIPADITSGNPKPSGWGQPTVIFNGGSGCNIDSFFQNNQFVFDTTFCGDWAGNVWSTSSCSNQASSCQAYVSANPGAFKNAYWTVNYVKVFQ